MLKQERILGSKSPTHIFIICSSLLAILTILVLQGDFSDDKKSASFCMLDAFFSFLSFILIIYFKELLLKSKKIILCSISALCFFPRGLFFFIIFYFLGYKKLEIGSEDLLYLIPFATGVVFSLIFFVKICFEYCLNKNERTYICFFFMVFNVLTISTFLMISNWTVNVSPWTLSFQIGTALIEFIILDIAIVCLACAKKIEAYLMSIGTAIIMGGDLWFKYGMTGQAFHVLVYGELLWMLGLFFILFGFVYICFNRDLELENWFRKTNAIQSRLILLIFGISIITLFTFIVLEYFFGMIKKNEFFSSLPAIVTIYSIVIVLLSTFFGKKFSVPFKKIVANINAISDDKNEKSFEKNFTIEEFIFLQHFIENTLDEKDKAKRHLSKITAQVAHDIRSPLTALQVLTSHRLTEVDESTRIMFRDAITQIRDIVNNLDREQEETFLTLTQIAVLLEQVVSEKRVELTGNSVDIVEKFSANTYALFAEVIASDLKRVVSNIINNAAEATKGNSIITLELFQFDEHIVIKIQDNGQGIPPRIIERLFERGFTTKQSGHGLGLFHAKETLQKFKGDIRLSSIEGSGTTVELILPFYKAPVWFVPALFLPKNTVFICVDDSRSVLNVWQERLAAFGRNVELRYYKDKFKLLSELGHEEMKHCVYLVDYEFSGESYTGLDLIKKIMLYKKAEDNVYLVTSRSTEASLQKFCKKNNILMIPKFFAAKIPIQLVD